jgi:hypothetical protein
MSRDGRGGLLLILLAAVVAFDPFGPPTAEGRAKRIVKKADVCVDTSRAIPDGSMTSRRGARGWWRRSE